MFFLKAKNRWDKLFEESPVGSRIRGYIWGTVFEGQEAGMLQLQAGDIGGLLDVRELLQFLLLWRMLREPAQIQKLVRQQSQKVPCVRQGLLIFFSISLTYFLLIFFYIFIFIIVFEYG